MAIICMVREAKKDLIMNSKGIIRRVKRYQELSYGGIRTIEKHQVKLVSSNLECVYEG